MVKTARDGCAEGLVYGGGGREGIFIKEVVPESPASKSLKLKEGDQILSATVYFDNMSYEDAVQILEHAQAYKVKLCLKRKPSAADAEPAFESDIIPVTITFKLSDSFCDKQKNRDIKTFYCPVADEQRKLELSPTTSDTESPIKSQVALKGKKKHKMKLPGLTKRGRISSSEDPDTDAPTSTQLLSPECLESSSEETPQVYVAEDLKGKEGQFKMPHLGFSMPKVKGTRLNLSSSKKDVEVTLPKTSAKIKLPKAPKIDASLGEAEVFISESKVEVKKPDLEMKPLQSNVEIDGQGSKFKIPTLGMSMQKVKEPEIHFGLSKKDGHVTLPEAKAAVKVPEVVLKELSAKVEINAPEIKVEAKVNEASASRFKMPTFKLPKFGVGTPNVSVELPDMDKDVKIDGADIKFPDEGSTVDILAPSIYIDGPSMDMKTTAAEQNGKGSKYKMPNLGFSMKGPKIEDIDVKLPETTVDVKLPDVDLGKVDVSLPEAKVEFKKPEMDLQFKDVDISLLHAKVNLPNVELKESSAEVEMKAPKIEAPISSMKESPSTFKLPTFKFPTFGATTPNVSTEVPDIDKEIKIDGADMHISVPHTVVDEAEIKAEVHVKRASVGVEVDAKLTKPKFSLPRFSFSNPSVKAPELDTSLQDATVAIPEGKVEVRRGEVELPECEAEVEASKFKMPKFGISTPKVTGPESLSKKDVDVTLSEAKAEIKLPNVKVREPEEEIKASEIKIGTKGTKGSPSKYKMPTFKFPKFGVGNQSATIAMPDKDVNIDGADITIPKEVLRVDIAAPSIDIEGPSIEHEGKGSKFKLPSLGFSGPQIKGPDIDLSLSKKDVDVTLPEAKAGVQLPDVKLKDTSTAMQIKGPGIDVQTTNVEGSSAKYKMPTFTFPKFGSATPKVNMKAKGSELDVSGSKFKMPKFGISMPKVKGPEIDLRFSEKDVDVTLPEANAEVKLPSVEVKQPSATVDIKAPEIEAETDNVEGSSSKFKMPKFKLPKFGVGSRTATIEVIDIEGPSIDREGKGSKFKLPSLGLSGPQIKGPDIDLSLSKKDVDVTLPEATAGVQLPDVKLKDTSTEMEIKGPGIDVQTTNVEGSSAKYKMPTFTFPKFGSATPKVSVEVPDVDKDIKVDVTAPSIDTEGLSVDMKAKGSELDVSGRKLKMPKFGISMPKVKGPEIDLRFSEKDVDVTLPEANAEVKLPSVEVKQPSATVDIKAPEIEAETDNVEGSSSKFKMPTFKLPKFGVGSRTATIEVPHMDKDVNIDGADIKIPENVISVDIAAPSIDIEGPSIDREGKGSTFELPSLVEIKAPQIKIGTKGSPSKYKMPTFKFPKFGVGTQSATI
uniref:PDZ domain-containing protein n=1 Tax=Cyclopterus lumpus TaxID=8103 RepID=A0A8C2XE57_CYCLU